MKNIVIIGGGPCGIMASYQIKKNNPSYNVILIDKSTLGKRIKVSGNGRCNFSNDNIDGKYYFNGKFIEHILLDYKKYEEDFYKEINLHFYSDEEGRRYPVTDSSKTVLNLLINSLKRLGVIIKENEEFIELKRENGKYKLITSIDTYFIDKIVFSIGGASQLYKYESYKKVINSLPYPIKINELKASLCPIRVYEKIDKSVVGKRASVNIKVKHFNKVVYQEKGEIIFKKDGISGIVIFNISNYLSSKKDLPNYKLVIDFVDGINEDEIKNELNMFSNLEVLSSYVVDEIASMINSLYEDVYKGLSNFELTCKELYPLADSQVTRGGISLDEINLNDLSLKQDNNIYFGGEMIDVDGICGGYNIFFAFASGYCIGKSLK